MRLDIERDDHRAPLEGYEPVDATSLGDNEVHILGPAPDGELMDLVVALLRSQTITTYIHVGCELELSPTERGVHVTGRHTYFTNCRNDVPLDFFLELEDGMLRIRGA